MDINKLLKGVNCSCGKRHTCDIEYVYIEHGAVNRLEALCKKYNNILIVADENTYGAAGDKTVAALADKNITKVVFTGRETLVPNEKAIDEVSQNLVGIDLILGIGSGVIQDLCKFVSFESKIPYIIVATAPSMDGYASDGAAMITDGMKVTYKAGLPRAIIADTSVLAKAPLDMIKAGFGDIIGKFSSLNDWKLAHLVNGEYFCQYIYDLTFAQIENTLNLASGILKRNEESIKALTEALITIGILLSFAGSSRPASGSEHHLSHFFEITGLVRGEDYFPHGIDVAYSAVITAEIREKLLSRAFPEKIYREAPEKYRNKMTEIYREVANGCIELQNEVGNYAADRGRAYTKKEKEIKDILAEMPSSEKVKEMLSLVELDISEFYNLYGADKINDAILYAKDLKDRYTVLWLNYDMFEKA